MRRGLRFFVLYTALWHIGALWLIIPAVGMTFVPTLMNEFPSLSCWISLVISLSGLMGLWYHLKNPSEQLSWREQELRAMRNITDGDFGFGQLLLLGSLLLVIARVVALTATPYIFIAWMATAGLLFFFPSYLLEIWRLDNLGQILGWDKSTPKES